MCDFHNYGLLTKGEIKSVRIVKIFGGYLKKYVGNLILYSLKASLDFERFQSNE